MNFLKKPSARVLGIYFGIVGTVQLLSGLLLVLGIFQLKGRVTTPVYYYGLVCGLLAVIFGILYLYYGLRIKTLISVNFRLLKGLLTTWLICTGVSIEIGIYYFGFHRQTLSQSLVTIFVYFYFMKNAKRLSAEMRAEN